jgi:hypothetical protein
VENKNDLAPTADITFRKKRGYYKDAMANLYKFEKLLLYGGAGTKMGSSAIKEDANMARAIWRKLKESARYFAEDRSAFPVNGTEAVATGWHQSCDGSW